MSMEVYVLSGKRLTSIADWQKGIDALGFDVRFVGEQSLAEREIILRAAYRDAPVLLEVTCVDLAYIRDAFPYVMLPEAAACLCLRWNMSFDGLIAAYQAAAAYAGLVQGMTIDSEEGVLKTVEATIATARGLAAESEMVKAEMDKMVAEFKR